MLSCIDVAYDLAFLLMDLCHRGVGATVDHAPVDNATVHITPVHITPAHITPVHITLANQLLNRWLDRTGDSAALALLPFFQSLRAAIRAHILAGTHRDDEATAYLTSATLHLQPGVPRLIAIGGLSGSGKSTLARGIAADFQPLPGARIIRSDSLRKRLAGVTPETRLPADSYTQAASDRVYAAMLAEARQVLAAGYTAIIDAAFLRAGERQAVDALAAEMRLPCHGIWLDVPADLLRDRLARRRDDASDADQSVLAQQLTFDLGPMTWRRLPAGADLTQDLASLRAVLI
jgi:predicted kinase